MTDWLLDGLGAMIATFLGVLAAFGLEHWSVGRREARAQAALARERNSLTGTLIGNLQSNLAGLHEINEADTWEEANINAAFLNVDFWHAVRNRMVDAGVDPANVAYFADFYHHVEQIGALLRKVAAGEGNARLYHHLDYGLDWALDIGHDLVRTWGDEKAKHSFPWPPPEVKEKSTPHQGAT